MHECMHFLYAEIKCVTNLQFVSDKPLDTCMWGTKSSSTQMKNCEISIYFCLISDYCSCSQTVNWSIKVHDRKPHQAYCLNKLCHNSSAYVNKPSFIKFGVTLDTALVLNLQLELHFDRRQTNETTGRVVTSNENVYATISMQDVCQLWLYWR